MFIISEDSDFSSEGSRSGRNWEEYFDFLRRQFHAASQANTKEFQRIMSMCQDIVFRGQGHQAKGKERAHDSSDSGESEINWQLDALRLNDEDDEDDAHNSEPRFGNQDNFGSSPVFYDDTTYNFNHDVTAEESHAAGPSSVLQPPTQSSLLVPMPVTPQQASETRPEPQLAQPPKRRQHRSKAQKVSITYSTTSHVDTLLPLPPPATPRKSTLSITLDSDFQVLSDNPFESPPPTRKKKVHGRKAKQRPTIEDSESDSEELIVAAQHLKKIMHSESASPRDNDEERGKLL